MLPAPASPTRIEDHALIGNTGSAALVRTDGTINWLCLPGFDSPAVFAELLGHNDHGFWRLGPAVYDSTAPPPATRRRYAGSTLVLEQEWDTEGGTVRISDFMPAPSAYGDPPPRVVRVVEGVSGTVRIASVFRPRPGYGALGPRISRTDDHGVPRLCATSGPDSYWLDSQHRHSAGRRGVCRADIEVHAGQRFAFTLTWQRSTMPAPPVPDAHAELAATTDYWQRWVSACTYRGPDHEAVVRAAITLKAMCHPDGGIIAAPTTSLPELIGGERNWDYRFVWVRDSALTVAALLRAGFTQEARAWRNYLTEVIDPADLRAIYRVTGSADLEEKVLGHLPGYEDSRPVRIGNGAAGQLQLDVYGELADALLLADDAGLPAHPGCDALLLALAERLEMLWGKPDEGIWEIRGPRRHFVHSKVMAWVCFDRTITLLQRRPRTPRSVLDRLRTVREAIHRDVCAGGYDPERNTFTQFYGSTELDAALLLIPQVGFLPADDKRVIGTVEAIQRELSTPDGFLLRYPTHADSDDNVDGLSGHEGAFLACSFWLVDALALIGRSAEARQLFDKLLALRNDVGLLAEEYDTRRGRQVGNYPQAFSMWTLMDSARAVRPAVMTKEERSGRPPVDRTPLIAWATGHLSEMLAQAPGEPDLTQQHTLALRHAAAGMSNAEIGQAMCLTEDTVKSHMVEVFNRLGARGRTGAFVIGLARGVIRPHDVLPAGSEPLELAATHRLLLLLIACGLSLPEVAALAEMSLDTVKSHLRVVLRRCGTTRSSHTVAVAIVLGLVQIPGLTLPVREPA